MGQVDNKAKKKTGQIHPSTDKSAASSQQIYRYEFSSHCFVDFKFFHRLRGQGLPGLDPFILFLIFKFKFIDFKKLNLNSNSLTLKKLNSNSLT